MSSDMGVLESRYRLLRKQLDELGYLSTLPMEALPLVERLTSDLLHTTESLRHYKELAQKSLEECSLLENGVEPYKQENAKLVRECNDLHIKFLKAKEEAERQQKEFKCQIRKLQSENSDLSFISSQHLLLVKELEKESAEKSLTILSLQNKSLHPVVVQPGGKKASAPSRRPTLEIDAPLDPPKSLNDRFWTSTAQTKDPLIVNMVEMCDERICSLSREVNLLREELSQQSEKILILESKIFSRDREIERLKCLLEGGRPLSAIDKDCHVKHMDIEIKLSKEEIKRLELENKELQVNLKETTANYNEAVSRCNKLAERVKHLETEMRDIDRVALSVEAEYNETVQENNKKVTKIQEKLGESLSQISNLEREILELKRSKQEQEAEVGKIRLEKQKVQKQLEVTREEKKKMIDKINKYTVIEKDLTNEIDRLTQLTSFQKRRITELESRSVKPSNSHSVSSGESRKSSNTGNTGKSMELRLQELQADRDRFKREYEILLQQTKSVPVQPDVMGAGDSSNTLKRVQSERDQYRLEMEKLHQKLTTLSYEMQEKENICAGEAENNVKLRRKLSDYERELERLQQCVQDLNYEKQNLQSRLDSRIISAVTRSAMTSPMSEGPGLPVAVILNQCLRERDLAKGDVMRLEDERDALRERLKISTETQVSEHARLEKTIMESEDRVRRLELERRDLMSANGALKGTITKLQAEVEMLVEKDRSSQSELSQQRSLYAQIKSLHEQTDRALADSQGQLTQLETELADAKDRIRSLETDRAALDKEVSSLKMEQTVLRGNLAQVDQEKDSLLLNIDSKTEQIAQLDRQLKLDESKIMDLERNVAELQRKLDISLEEQAAREQALRAAEREAEALQGEATALQRARDGVLRENRRLQDDLAAAALDARQAQRDLQAARDEVEALKRQLQDYVAEIRRIEEMLQRKENERSEMLEQFRGLSVEATMLETNNHSLESEATETKHQLSEAKEKISDLEQQLENKDSLVQSYENQIAELTANVAGLERQVQDFVESRQKNDADLDALRDLCMKLDSQKEALQQELNKNDVVKIQWESEISRLQDEQELLQQQLSKDRENIASLENVLASARQETAEQKQENEQMRAEIDRLQLRVNTLQTKLDAETTELQRYQYQANEYSKQITDLQRQITNERFERARASEESRRNQDPCCPCPDIRPSYPKVVGASTVRQSGTSVVHESVSSPPHYSPPKGPPAGRNYPLFAASGGPPPRRRPNYLAPPPTTDWGPFKTYPPSRGVPPAYISETPCTQTGLPCTRASCPLMGFPQQARPTYLTGPRPLSPETVRGTYYCNRPSCPFAQLLGTPMGYYASASANGAHQPVVETSAPGDHGARCCPCTSHATSKPQSVSTPKSPSNQLRTEVKRFSSESSEDKDPAKSLHSSRDSSETSMQAAVQETRKAVHKGKISAHKKPSSKDSTKASQTSKR